MRGRIDKKKPTAVYRFFANDGRLLYVGCSANPFSRLQYHVKTRTWAMDVARVEVSWFETGAEAMDAEKAAIAAEMPEWNVQHRDNPKHEVTQREIYKRGGVIYRSEAFARFMEENNLRNKDFAQELGCDAVTVWRLRVGRMRPGLDLASRIAAVTAGAVPSSYWVPQ